MDIKAAISEIVQHPDLPVAAAADGNPPSTGGAGTGETVGGRSKPRPYG